MEKNIKTEEKVGKTYKKKRSEALYNATAPFRQTKKETISRICSVGVKHKWLKWPSFVAAFVFILFANIAFYVSLWFLLNKKLVIGLAITVTAFIGLFFVLRDYYDTNDFYTATRDNYVISVKDETVTEKEDKYISREEIENPDYEPKWYEKVKVDLTGLQEDNPDIVGWIYFENEDISYPILQGETNDDYINTTYEGKSARAGSIFLESLNSPSFNDDHTIIYGHNMRNLSMFGKLRYYYSDENYYPEHKYFQILTPDALYRYEIVSCKHVAANDEIFSVYGEDTIGFAEFLENCIMSDSIIESDYQPTYKDKIVTLSTCSSGDNRFIVNAVRVDKY